MEIWVGVKSGWDRTLLDECPVPERLFWTSVDEEDLSGAGGIGLRETLVTKW